MYIESLKCDNLDQLEIKILKYRTSMKRSDLKEYFQLLRQLLPKYEKIIWNKTYSKLVDTKKKLTALMIKYNYDNIIKKVIKFYGINEHKVSVFEIGLYPISSGNNINAYRIKNIETVGVLVNKNQNLHWLLTATILHEISHTIYFNSKLVKNNFSLKDKQDKQILIEGFATVIGAGWGYKQLTGKLYKGKWYNNNNYDKFAKTIFTDVEYYLNHNMTMDKQLIKKAKDLL